MDIYAGWFLGLGVNYQYTKGEATLSDNIITIRAVESFQDKNLLTSNVGRIGGTVLVGYGDFTGRCYLGGEFSLDIAGRRSKESSEVFNYSVLMPDEPPVPYGKTTIKTGAFIPTLAARAGLYFPTLDSVIYVRVGFTFLNNKFENTYMRDKDIVCQKISPIVGVGIEKNIFGKYTVRIEGDYRFPANKTENLNRYDGQTRVDGYVGQVKNKVRGYAIRLIGTYHF